jgi:hypothetical protein
MKATAFEFKFRFLIIVAICVIGFVAPWDFVWHLDTIRTWQWVAARLSRTGWMGFSGATDEVLVAGIVLALVAAVLRTWGAAYSGDEVKVEAGGWIRRAPFLGGFLNVVAISLLMLPTGAMFTIVAMAIFMWRLAGVAAVRISLRPRWGAAFLGEIYMWGVVVSFAALGWRYNSLLVMQGVLVSLGVSIVVKAFLPNS